MLKNDFEIDYKKKRKIILKEKQIVFFVKFLFLLYYL